MTKVFCKLGEKMRTHNKIDGFDKDIFLDAPKSIGGCGEEPSPTDLFALSLGSCMLMMMGIAANQNKIDISGTNVHVEKTMKGLVVSFNVEIKCPHDLSNADKNRVMHAAKHCPVHQAMGKHVEQHIKFHFGAESCVS